MLKSISFLSLSDLTFFVYLLFLISLGSIRKIATKEYILSYPLYTLSRICRFVPVQEILIIKEKQLHNNFLSVLNIVLSIYFHLLLFKKIIIEFLMMIFLWYKDLYSPSRYTVFCDSSGFEENR